MVFPVSYPLDVPEIIIDPVLYHPSVSQGKSNPGHVSLNILLQKNWNPKIHVSDSKQEKFDIT